MENKQQLQSIHAALKKEKERWIFELTKLISIIEKKQYLIEKMLAYQKDYDQKDKLEISRSNPMLLKNLDLFYTKMLDALFKAEYELEKLNESKNLLLGKINSIDQKMKVMEIFEERITENEKLANDRREQHISSDLTINKYSRGEHE